ncbi:hypothetical protein FA95DRAFT_1577331 [Auriscalpium vulgare]|uniref:Uncharacterized protein n=1 Tax=Auriscalpium vulgare TaxID=40419 RepID=A0ACB8R8G5_9AGAM|nr:hypothetical protein FA95DRAFT_1577331 [Auriscalpium vulgare]
MLRMPKTRFARNAPKIASWKMGGETRAVPTTTNINLICDIRSLGRARRDHIARGYAAHAPRRMVMYSTVAAVEEGESSAAAAGMDRMAVVCGCGGSVQRLKAWCDRISKKLQLKASQYGDLHHWVHIGVDLDLGDFRLRLWQQATTHQLMNKADDQKVEYDKFTARRQQATRTASPTISTSSARRTSLPEHPVSTRLA